MSSLTSAIGGKHTYQLCGYQTLKKTQLKQHEQAVHDARKLQCPVCEYQATHKGHLEFTHKSVHMGRTL